MLATLVASAPRGVVAPAFGGGDATIVGESPVVHRFIPMSASLAPGSGALLDVQLQVPRVPSCKVQALHTK